MPYFGIRTSSGELRVGLVTEWPPRKAAFDVVTVTCRTIAGAGRSEGWRTPESIESSFRDLDANGVCMAVGEYQRHAYGIALPVALGRPQTDMALSCGAVDVTRDIASIRARVVPAFKETAQELASLLEHLAIPKYGRASPV